MTKLSSIISLAWDRLVGIGTSRGPIHPGYFEEENTGGASATRENTGRASATQPHTGGASATRENTGRASATRENTGRASATQPNTGGASATREVDDAPVAAQQAPRTWLAAALVADFIQLAAAGFLLDFLLFGDTGIHLLPRLVALTGLLLTTLRSLGWPVLLAIQLSLLIREPSDRDMLHGMNSLVVCLAAIGLVAYASSFETTRREFRNLVAATVHAAVHGNRFPLPAQFLAPQYPTLAIRACILVAVVLASMLVFIELPIAAPMRQQWWQSSLASGLVLWPGPAAVVLAIALMIAFSHSEWRPVTRVQASLYLRSMLMHSHYRDLKMIVKRRLKAARNAASESR